MIVIDLHVLSCAIVTYTSVRQHDFQVSEVVLAVLEDGIALLAQVALHLDLLVQLADIRLVDALAREELLDLGGDVIKEFVTRYGKRYCPAIRCNITIRWGS